MAFSAMDDDEYERLSDVDVNIDKDEDEDRRSSSSSFENILARDNDDTVDAMPPNVVPRGYATDRQPRKSSMSF